MAPTSHTAKRPYGGTHSHAQSTITSYFTPSLPCASTTVYPASTAVQSNGPISPPLPNHIQSSLLSVGMRVRKSVPEGYKTGSQYSAFGLFSDSAPVKAIPQPYISASSTATTAYRRAELTPFCGILKVGGLGVQEYGADQDVPDEDDIPFLSSQGSTITNASEDDIELSRGKRRFSDEEETETEVVADDAAVNVGSYGSTGIWRDEPVSPRTRPVDAKTPFGLGFGSRVMAKPRSRRPGMPALRRQKSETEGQENAMLDVDFGEAEFLDYSAWKRDEMEL